MAEATKKEFTVCARNVRMSARKARLVMDAVRGRDADEAVMLLQFVNKRAAPAVKKLIESAVANAEEYGNRNGIDMETGSLVVAEARADEGPRMKRWRPRSRGMANPFTRYTCHLIVTLADADHLAEKAKGRPAWRKPRKRMSRDERLIKVGRMAAPAPVEAKKQEPGAPATGKPAQQSEAEAEATPAKKAEKAPAKKAEAKPEKKPAKKAETKSAGKSEKKAEKKPAKKDTKDSTKDSKKKK